MTGRIHMAGGAMAGVVAVYYLQGMKPEVCALAAGAAFGALGGILPDLDSKTSMANHTFPHLSGVICRLTEHRGFMHSLILPLIFFLALTCFRHGGFLSEAWYQILLAIPAGYVVHLVQDTFTCYGIAWLFPFSRWRYTLYFGNRTVWSEIFITAVLIAGAIQVCNLAVAGCLIKLP